MTKDGILLGVDTCGATGSVALARAGRAGVEQLGEASIAGGEFAARLIPEIAGLLAAQGMGAQELAGIVAVAGPGSFTGIRVGLAAVKGLAEAGGLPVVTVSRLALLAELGKAPCAVLDAHRGQLYFGMHGERPAREILLTAGEINAMGGLAGRIAVCEESVAQLLEELAGAPEIARVRPPEAADALKYALGKWRAGEFADLASLDGHYLRGADAKAMARLR